jgi:hypothetical protein
VFIFRILSPWKCCLLFHWFRQIVPHQLFTKLVYISLFYSSLVL